MTKSNKQLTIFALTLLLAVQTVASPLTCLQLTSRLDNAGSKGVSIPNGDSSRDSNESREIKVTRKSFAATKGTPEFSEQMLQLVELVTRGPGIKISAKEILEKDSLSVAQLISDRLLLSFDYESTDSSGLPGYRLVGEPVLRDMQSDVLKVKLGGPSHFDGDSLFYKLNLAEGNNVQRPEVVIPKFISGDIVNELRRIAPRLDLVSDLAGKPKVLQLLKAESYAHFKFKLGSYYWGYTLRDFFTHQIPRKTFGALFVTAFGIISVFQLSQIDKASIKITQRAGGATDAAWVTATFENLVLRKELPLKVREEILALIGELNKPGAESVSRIYSQIDYKKIRDENKIGDGVYVWLTYLQQVESGGLIPVLTIAREDGSDKLNFNSFMVDPVRYANLLTYLKVRVAEIPANAAAKPAALPNKGPQVLNSDEPNASRR